MSRVIIVIMLSFYSFGLFVQDGIAGGAVARRRQKVRVRRHIRLTPIGPSGSGTPSTSTNEEEKEAIKEEKEEEKNKAYISSDKVLVSSSNNGNNRINNAAVVIVDGNKEEFLGNSFNVNNSQKWTKLFSELNQSSMVWFNLGDVRIKMFVVSSYIERYRQNGVEISKAPMYYVNVINSMSAKNPSMLRRPFSEVLKVVAIIEYDFNNGMNKDTLARQILNQKTYIENRKRLGLQ